MTIKGRLSKLERSKFDNSGTPASFIRVVNPFDSEKQNCTAEYHVADTVRGRLRRGENETEGEFLRRVYSGIRSAKPVDQLTEKEMEIFAASIDEEAARAMAETGGLPDDVLKNVISRLDELVKDLRKQDGEQV